MRRRPAVRKIHGHCDQRLAVLRDAFALNFAEHSEVGAAIAVTLEGRPVVDLWAGSADRARTRAWRRDTLVDVFSVGKPMVALCLLMLIERGQVDLDDRVAEHWPELAAAGKGEVTVQMLLGHRAGLPGIRPPLPPSAMYDWQLMTSALAAEQPWWRPGEKHGYHVNTFGFLVGELVRRCSGESVGAFFERSIARPLGADFHFGLSGTQEQRVADFLFPDVPPAAIDAEATSLLRSVYLNPPGLSGFGTVNSREWRAAEIPSANGHATARAVARIYSALAGGGAVDGVRLLDPGTVALAAREVSSGRDAVLDRPSRFGLGFQLTQPERPLGPNPNSFGHFGAGGSLGFADPDHALAFAYVTSQGAGPRWQNPRNRGLLDALYASL
jgi:CubicO group peptidase (beta-lactamase class C family)